VPVLLRNLQNVLPANLLPVRPAHVLLRRFDDLIVRIAVDDVPAAANPVFVQRESPFLEMARSSNVPAYPTLFHNPSGSPRARFARQRR